jgi:hypothetical protein
LSDPAHHVVRIRRGVRPATSIHHWVSSRQPVPRIELTPRFTGSAGTAIIPSSGIDTDALLFVDSRYWIQAEKQIPKQGWKVVRVGNSGGSGAVSVEKGWMEWVIDVSPFCAVSQNLTHRVSRMEVELVSIQSSSLWVRSRLTGPQSPKLIDRCPTIHQSAFGRRVVDDKIGLPQHQPHRQGP